MADVKISALPASTTPLAGTEVLPIVQSGVTKQVSVADLTAGRAISATQYTSTIATGTAPLVVASTTEVENLKAATATLADSANAVKSNATTGLMQVVGPAAGTTRVMTTPDANFTAARTDAGQTFTGVQVLNDNVGVKITPSAWYSPAGYAALQVCTASLAARGVSMLLNSNGYTSTSDGGWKYIQSDYATSYAQYSGQHVWFTAPSGTAGDTINYVQAMTLDASGNLLINTASIVTAKLQAYQTTAGQWAQALKSTSDGSGVYYTSFHADNGSQTGYIYYNGSQTVYSTSSDERLKENIVDAPSALNDINAIKVRSFDWKESGIHQQFGVVAQEIKEIAPDVVAVPPEENGMLGVDYGLFVPRLIKAIQEQQEQINELKSEIAALKA